jgi:hypothetical protein
MGIVNSPSTYAGFPIGLEVAPCDVVLEIAATVAIGDVVAIAPAASLGNRFTTTQAPASDNVSIDDNEFGVFAVALEAATYDASTTTYAKFRVQGVVNALIDGTPAKGAAVAVKLSTGDLTAPAAGNKIVGFMMEAGVGGETKQVLFDGLNGFGTKHA